MVKQLLFFINDTNTHIHTYICTYLLLLSSLTPVLADVSSCVMCLFFSLEDTVFGCVFAQCLAILVLLDNVSIYGL